MLIIEIITLALLITLTVYGILLIRSFGFLSLPELKRQARSGNKDATKVYPVRAYGLQLWIFIWLILGFFITGTVLLTKDIFGPWGSWVALLINAPLVVLLHAVLPLTKRPKPSIHMAAVASPYIELILRKTFPILRRLEKWLNHFVQPEQHTLIQSKDELVEILHHNATRFKSEAIKSQLKIAERALLFGDELVSEHMAPLAKVKFINANEELTPVVIGELHDSGRARFPVYEGTNQNIIGTLHLRDAVRIKIPKLASKVMRDEVKFINEQSSLSYALNGFIKTKHHLFVVVNEFKDVVGVISIEDVIEQIIGPQENGKDDQFDDLSLASQKTHP